MIFFLSQREDVFNLPVKIQKKICSGRSFGNIKIFQPGNTKGFFTMQVTACRGTKTFCVTWIVTLKGKSNICQ